MNVNISAINDLKKLGQAFLAWWITGLLYLVPDRVRQKIVHAPDRLTIEKNNREFILKHYRGGTGELLEKRAFPHDNELDKASAVQWLSRIKQDDTEIIIIIPKEDALNKSLELPLASEADLNDILGFEMDRQTPFTVDNVYYDSRITGRDQERQKIHLQLFVVLREKIDPLLEEIRSWRLQPGKVTLQSRGGPVEDINLLPAAFRNVRNRHVNPLTRALAAASLLLFISLLYIPLLLQQQIMEDLESQMVQTRESAKEVLPLLKEKEDILSRTQFLTDIQKDQPLVIDMLKELTAILPDDTWVNRLIIRDDEVQLHGESDSATSIIQLIEDSDFFKNAQFRSPVTRNNTTQKDKFHVSATITGDAAS